MLENWYHEVRRLYSVSTVESPFEAETGFVYSHARELLISMKICHVKAPLHASQPQGS
jgi:hypothetical protein